MSDHAPEPVSTPYWWEAAPLSPLPSRSLPSAVDVLIVGAGYAGLSAGLTLARAGRSVAIFDRQDPGEGASTRNGGITSGNLRPDHATLARRFGAERAIAIEAEGRTARDFLYAMIEEEGIDCDLQLTGRFTGALGTQDYEALARAADRLRRTLGIEAHAVPCGEQRSVIGTDFYRGGLVRMDIGGLHPAKFHAGLMRVALAAGVELHARTPVEGVAREGSGFEVRTAAGRVRAQQVLICTNGYTDGADPWLRRRMVPVRSRIIATPELAPELMARLMPPRMMYGETRELGFYYRPSPDGRRILFGGRDLRTLGEKGLERIRGRQIAGKQVEVQLFPLVTAAQSDIQSLQSLLSIQHQQLGTLVLRHIEVRQFQSMVVVVNELPPTNL